MGESADWANTGGLVNTGKEFDQFQDNWGNVDDAVRAVAPSIASHIDAVIAQVSAVIGDVSQSPPQAQYQPLVANLLKVVQDANALISSQCAIRQLKIDVLSDLAPVRILDPESNRVDQTLRLLHLSAARVVRVTWLLFAKELQELLVSRRCGLWRANRTDEYGFEHAGT